MNDKFSNEFASNMIIYSLFTVLLFSTLTFAVAPPGGGGGTPTTTVNAAFQNSIGNLYHFNTQLDFQTTVTFSASSNNVVKGNANNLKSGDIVCSQATITVAPSYILAEWGTKGAEVTFEDFDWTCTSNGCAPNLVNAGAAPSGFDIKWINQQQYSNHIKQTNYVQGTQGGVDLYNDLGGNSVFLSIPMTYINTSGSFPNKDGGAGVFCKGTFSVSDNGNVKGSSAAESPKTASFSISGVGQHTVAASLTGVSCLAAAVRHPLPNHPEFFLLTYYNKNAPAIQDGSVSQSIKVNVQNPGGACSLSQVSISSKGSIQNNDIQIVTVTVKNNGPNAIQVKSVASSNNGYTATRLYSNNFNKNGCDQIFAGGLCPQSDGFNSDVNPNGGTATLYVLLERKNPQAGQTTLTFTAESSKPICGVAETCSMTTSQLTPTQNAACKITPGTATFGTNEVAQFTVACTDNTGKVIPCSGDQWAFAGVNGAFVLKNNAEAVVFSTSPDGTKGKITYSTTGVSCEAAISIVNPNGGKPTYECKLDPATATMDVLESKNFALKCTKNNAPFTPDQGSGYDLMNGLDGKFSNSGVLGTDFTSSNVPSAGQILGIGYFTVPNSNVIGAVAFAQV
ncbi:hypothetical protein HY988_04070, partial [Candidatus Micrarchaeota archaeon]|nr:hypothetical protein [Candidatus Micrarchaeota archaeon]